MKIIDLKIMKASKNNTFEQKTSPVVLQ